jgi:hypothetical protein
MDDSKARRQSSVLAAAGAGFLVLAGFFLWRDLALPRELVLLAAVVVSGAATLLRWPRLWPAAAPIVLFGATALGAGWYAIERSPAVLPALAAAVAIAAAAVVQLELRPPAARAGWSGQVTWYAFGAALLASTWALYFTFFTTGFAADSVARRLIPTLVWLALGLAIFLAGRLRTPAAVHVGVGLMAVAVVKAVAYDTTHLHGGLRVVVLAAVGALLLFGARTLGPAAAPARKGVA